MFRKIMFERRRFALALLVVLTAGVGLTVAAIVVDDDVARDLLLNLGSTALGVFLTAIVLEPLIEKARRPEEIVHSAFPHGEFISSVAGARRQVRIKGAWPYIMDAPWRKPFLAASRSALRRGSRAQILVLDPLSHAAAQRRDDLDNQIDVAGIISETLTALDDFYASLPAVDRERFEVRVYSALPPARLYSVDQRALCSFFPLGSNLGTDVRHYETNVTSGIARFVDEQFETVWRHEDTRGLIDYLYVHVVVDSTNRQHRAQHVAIDSEIYIASADLVDDYFRNSEGSGLVHLAGSERIIVRDLTLRVVPDAHPRVTEISLAFETKYGSKNELIGGFHAVVHLSPPPDAAPVRRWTGKR